MYKSATPGRSRRPSSGSLIIGSFTPRSGSHGGGGGIAAAAAPSQPSLRGWTGGGAAAAAVAPPPMRGAAAGRPAALAVFQSLVSRGGGAATDAEPGSDQKQQQQQQQQAKAAAAAAATESQQPIIIISTMPEHAAHAAAASSGKAANEPACSTKGPVDVVKALSGALDALRRCASALSAAGAGSYLYLHHKEVADATAALAACDAGVAALSNSSSSDVVLVKHLQDASASCWDLTCAILSRAHNASSADEALPFHNTARRMWRAVAESRCDGGAPADDPNEATRLLAPLARAGRAWLGLGRADAAEWPFQVLREHLSAIEAAAADARAPAETRGAAQLLQFYALQGSIALASTAGHQALWGNLVARMQRLLDGCLLAPGVVAQMCAELADTLAAQAAKAATNNSGSGSTCTPAQLLKCAEGLLVHAVAIAQPQQQRDDGNKVAGSQAEGDSGTAAAVQLWELQASLLEVRLRTVEALLAEGNAADARAAAVALLDAMAAARSPADDDGVGLAAELPLTADSGGSSSTRAAKLLVRACLAMGREADAAGALCGWLGDGCPDAPAAGEVLAALAEGCDLAQRESTERLFDAATAAVRAFPGCHEPALALVEPLLARAANGGPALADGVALRLLADDGVADAIKAAPAVRNRVHALLYARGRGGQARLPPAAHNASAAATAAAARETLASALFFAPPGAATARAARMLAASCAAAGQASAALGYLARAARHEPPGTSSECAAGKLLELRVRLQALAAGGGDGAAAPNGDGLQQVCKVIDALASASPPNGCTVCDVMKIACDECAAAGANAAAWHALCAWRRALIAAPSISGGVAVFGRVLSVWRAVAQQPKEQQQQQQVASASDVLAEVAAAATVYAAAFGREKQPQNNGDAAAEAAAACLTVRQEKAMAVAKAARELGVEGVRARLWVPASALLEASAELLLAVAADLAAKPCECGACSSRQEDAAAYAAQLKAARAHLLRLAAAALACAHDAAPADASLLCRAKEALSRAEAAASPAAPISVAGQQQQQQQCDKMDDLHRAQLEIALDVQAAAAPKKLQRRLAALAALPQARTSDALRIALACLAPRPWRSEPSASLALGFALRLAAERGSGDDDGSGAGGSSSAAKSWDEAAAAADVAQRLLQVSSSRAVRLRVFDRVADALARWGLGGGGGGNAPAIADPPRQQLRWLVACCWNAAVRAARDGDGEGAAAYYARWRRLEPFVSAGGGGGGAAAAAAAAGPKRPAVSAEPSEAEAGSASGSGCSSRGGGASPPRPGAVESPPRAACAAARAGDEPLPTGGGGSADGAGGAACSSPPPGGSGCVAVAPTQRLTPEQEEEVAASLAPPASDERGGGAASEEGEERAAASDAAPPAKRARRPVEGVEGCESGAAPVAAKAPSVLDQLD